MTACVPAAYTGKNGEQKGNGNGNGETCQKQNGPGPLRPAGRAARTGPCQHDAVSCLLGSGVPVRRRNEVVCRDAGSSVAAIHLLGVHPAFRLLCAAGAPHSAARRDGLRSRGAGHGGDAALYAGGPGRLRRAHPAGLGHVAERPAGAAAEKGTARCRSRRGGGAVRADLSCGGPLPRHRCAAAGPAGKSVCQLLHGLSGFLPVVVLFYRLFPAGAVAVFVLVRLFPARGRGRTRGTAAPFGLRPAWLDRPAFAGAVSAASAGHLWGALGHLPNFSLKRLDTARQLWYPIGG